MKIIKNFILRRVGKFIAKRLFKGGKMGEKKKWYQSKTILTAIAVVVVSGYEMVDATLGPAIGFNLPDVPAWVFTILGALGIYSRAVATKKIK